MLTSTRHTEKSRYLIVVYIFLIVLLFSLKNKEKKKRYWNRNKYKIETTKKKNQRYEITIKTFTNSFTSSEKGTITMATYLMVDLMPYFIQGMHNNEGNYTRNRRNRTNNKKTDITIIDETIPTYRLISSVCIRFDIATTGCDYTSSLVLFIVTL